MRAIALSVLMVTAFALNARAENTDIEYLLSALETSGCEFWRNGKLHSAEKAARHLRMKFERSKKHVNSAEDFIAKLASRSSLSGKPYRYSCPDGSNGLTAVWFRQKLTERSTQAGFH